MDRAGPEHDLIAAEERRESKRHGHRVWCSSGGQLDVSDLVGRCAVELGERDLQRPIQRPVLQKREVADDELPPPIGAHFAGDEERALPQGRERGGGWAKRLDLGPPAFHPPPSRPRGTHVPEDEEPATWVGVGAPGGDQDFDDLFWLTAVQEVRAAAPAQAVEVDRELHRTLSVREHDALLAGAPNLAQHQRPGGPEAKRRGRRQTSRGVLPQADGAELVAPGRPRIVVVGERDTVRVQ